VSGQHDSGDALSRPVEQCRSCGGAHLEVVLDLGRTPLANALPTDPSAPEPSYPLAVAKCRDCALVQTTYWVSGEVIFGGDYPYFSSFSTDYLHHAREHALELIERRALGPESLVVEIASNDGYLLRNFVEKGVPVLGIDPARGPAETAREIGVPTLEEYFGPDLARRLRDDGQRADVMLANNVLAHVDDPKELAAGIAILLKPEGVAVFEVPYLVDLVE
jgi:SAM-dependent methyltransferase